MSYSIQINNLTKIFNARSKQAIKALDEVSFNIEEGIIFGLLGPNGAGKTTLIKILLGIVLPTSGNAMILDQDIMDFRIRQKVGYLPENHKFPNYLSGEEVIVYSARLSGCKIEKNSKIITEVLNLVKMEKWRKTKIKKYSKGMLQRLGLAQAIVHDPQIIFLDEPTDGVDPIGRKEIRDILVGLKNKGKTVFINSHLLSEVEMVSDKVAILNDGKLVKFGTVEELTIDKQICEIKIENPLTEKNYAFLQNKYSFSFNKDLITLDIDNSDTLNSFMDNLRDMKLNISSVNKKKTSLEDLFIKSLNNSDK